MSDIFISSDTHYFHTNVIKYCSRPFESREEMNEILVQEHNKIVKPGDTFYHLGDFGFCPREEVELLLSRLNGTKYLIRGNHDDRRVTGASGWSGVYENLLMNLAGYDIVMNHYAPTGDQEYDIWLHGHSHATLPPTPCILDVGVDNAYKLLGQFRPFSLEDIADALDQIEKSGAPAAV